MFSIEAIIGDRYDSTDSLTEDEIHQWLLNMQRQDILKAETETEYWEDVPEKIFELFSQLKLLFETALIEFKKFCHTIQIIAVLKILTRSTPIKTCSFMVYNFFTHFQK